MNQQTEATELLAGIRVSDDQQAERLLELVYDELRSLAAGYLAQEDRGHTLQPTALVHEAFLKLVDQKSVDWHGRSHFFAVGAQAMRRILVDHARSKKRRKRGGERVRVALDESTRLSTRQPEDALALDEALTKLASQNAIQAQIVELRFFGGMTLSEIAATLEISKRTVERHWTVIRAWLRRELAEEHDE